MNKQERQKALAQAKLKNPLGTGFDLKVFKHDEEAVEMLLDRISAGYSLRQFCLEVGLDKAAQSSIGRWLTSLKAEDEWGQEYELARRARATHFAERMLEIIEKVEEGVMTPQQGSMCVKSLQWLAERLDPEEWSGRVKIDQTVKLDATKAHLEAVRELAGMVKSGQRGSVIDQFNHQGERVVKVVEEMDPEDEAEIIPLLE